MKKLVVLLVTSCLFSGLINGQDTTATANHTAIANQYAIGNQQTIENQALPAKPNFWFGPKVGMDLLELTTNQNVIGNQLKSNYRVGFFMQFGRTIYFQPEFYYSMHKLGITSTNKAQVTTNSLEIPMLLGIKLIDLRVLSIHVMGGPQFSFLLSETRNTRNYCNCRDYSNLSLTGGGGVDVLGFITLDVRYSATIEKLVGAYMNNYSQGKGVNVTVGFKLR